MPSPFRAIPCQIIILRKWAFFNIKRTYFYKYGQISFYLSTYCAILSIFSDCRNFRFSSLSQFLYVVECRIIQFSNDDFHRALPSYKPGFIVCFDRMFQSIKKVSRRVLSSRRIYLGLVEGRGLFLSGKHSINILCF